MSFSVRRSSLLLASVALLSLSVSACTFTKDDPAKAANGGLSAQEKSVQAASAPAPLAPATGLRLTPLFAEPVKGSEARFRRLEDAVQTIRDDLDVYAPAMDQRMDIMEGAVGNIEARQQDTAAKTEVLVKQAAKPIGDVKAVRIGDHLDKTRIVFDLTAVPEGRSRIEKNGRLLVVELPRLNWAAGKDAWTAKGGALVSGWKYADGQLFVDLIAPATVKEQQVLQGGGKTQPKLVIDLFAKGIHQ